MLGPSQFLHGNKLVVSPHFRMQNPVKVRGRIRPKHDETTLRLKEISRSYQTKYSPVL